MGGTIRGHHRWRRRATALAVTAALIGFAPLPIRAARASAVPEPFIPGQGQAQAQTITIGVGLGGIQIPIRFGTAGSVYTANNAKATAGLMDLGVIGLLGGMSLCEGQPPPIPPGALPAPLQADSADGDGSATRDDIDGGPADAGHAEVTVRSGSVALATSQLGTIGIPGLIEVGGGVAHTEAELVPDVSRRGTGTSELSRLVLAGGLVTLEDLRWGAEHRSGTDAVASGTFTIGALTILGLPVAVDSPEQLAAALSQISEVLAPFALRILWPQVTTADGGVEVSTLRIELGDGATLAGLLAPAAGSDQQLRQLVTDLVLGSGCSDGGGLGGPQLAQMAGLGVTVADVVLGMIAGHQRVTIGLGGVSVGTSGVAYANPFGPGAAPSLPPPVSGAPAAPAPPAPASATPAAPTSPSAAAATQPRIDSSSTISCETTSPVGAPGCWIGRPQLAGLVSLLAVAGLFTMDILAGRRNRRRPQLSDLEGTS